MQHKRPAAVNGHVFIVARKSGPVFYAKWRDENGQHKKALGPAWVRDIGKDGRGKTMWRAESGPKPPGYLSEKDAVARLEEIKVLARKGQASRRKTGHTFAHAAEAWLHQARVERGCKPSTLVDYRSIVDAHLLPAFGNRPVEQITSKEIERWRTGQLELALKHHKPGERVTHGLSPRTCNKVLTVMHGIYELARKRLDLDHNPVAKVDKLRERIDPERYDFYTPDEIELLCQAAADEQDAALFKTAAFTGMRRGELIALRWGDVDFQRSCIRVFGSYSGGQLTTPKSGRARVIPMVPDLAAVLARLGQRGWATRDDDLVFIGEYDSYMDGSALRRRYVDAQKRAGLRPLRFHDLRHTFGSLAIDKASPVQVQAWMGHADARTTARYLHHKDRADDAEILAAAFAGETTRFQATAESAAVADETLQDPKIAEIVRQTVIELASAAIREPAD